MAIAGEQAVFEILVDGSKAKSELNSVRASSHGLGGGLDSVKRGLEGVDNAASKTVQKGLGSLRFALGGSAGKAVELIDNLGDLAGALASGGALGLGLAAATFAGVKLAEAFENIKDGERAFSEGVIAARKSLDDMRTKSLEPGRQAVIALAKEIRDFGKTSDQLSFEMLNADALRLDKSVEALNVRIGKRTAITKDADQNMITENLKHQREQVLIEQKAADERLSNFINDRIEKERLVKEQKAKEKREREAEVAAAKAPPGADEKARKFEDIMEVLGVEPEDKKAARLDREAKLAQTQHEKLLDEERKMNEEMIRQAGVVAKEKERLREKELASTTALTQEVVGIAVGSSQALVTALITGQDHAAEMFAISVAKQAGTAMIGHGVNALAGGIAANVLIPGSGLAAMGTGLGLIGGGLAIGGLVTGAESLLSGGATGKTASGAALADPGVNVGSSFTSGGGSSGGGGGGVTIYEYNYGVAGPAPDESARVIAEQGRRAQARGFFSTNVTSGR